MLEPPYIFGAKCQSLLRRIEQWAITLSLKDGCFWANLLSVYGTSLPFPLSIDLEALIESLGSSPLARPAYPGRTDCLTRNCGIRSLVKCLSLRWKHSSSSSTPTIHHQTLYLYIFRREPAIPALDWHITSNLKSSDSFAALIRSVLLPTFIDTQPAQG